MTKAQERLAVFVCGIVFTIAIIVMAIVFPTPTLFQYNVFRIVLSVAIAGIAAFIPGFIEVEVPGWIKAGGALAVFIVVYTTNPAQLVVDPPPIAPVVLGPSQYPPDAIIESRPTADDLNAPSPVAAEKVLLRYRNITGDNLKLFVYDFSKSKRAASGPFAPSVYWQAWPFPADENYQYAPEFRNSSGWLAFAVGRFGPDGRGINFEYLATKNIFYSETPTLTVKSVTANGGTYAAEFGTLEDGE